MNAKERPRGAGDANTALHLGTGPHYTRTPPDRHPLPPVARTVSNLPLNPHERSGYDK